MRTHASQNLPVAAAAPAEAWPKMDLSLLDERHGAPPPFPLDVLPSFWRTWTQAATASTGAPADYVALSLLTAAGSLIPGRRVMPAPGWVEPCILWTALVGPPSCGKTPAVEAACGLVRGVWNQRWLEAQQQTGRDEPLFTNGTTIDAILEAMRQAQPRGMLLVRDEQEGWLAHMARGTRDGSAHAFWLSAWCRRGLAFGWRGKTIELEEPSLAILGTAHPEALVPALRRDDGGVLARFLFVRPVPSADYQPLSGADAWAPEAIASLRRLYGLPGVNRDLSLTGETRAAFERFRCAHRAPMPDLAGKEAAWWGKGPSQVLRLAGVLTFLDWAVQAPGTAEPEQVPAWAIEAAVRLWRDYLWPHARATFRIAGAGGERESRQRQVLRWIRAQSLPEVSREDIRREALSQAVDAAGADRLIADLVEAGLLQPVVPAKGGRGRRRRRWHVHPDLWERACRRRICWGRATPAFPRPPKRVSCRCIWPKRTSRRRVAHRPERHRRATSSRPVPFPQFPQATLPWQRLSPSLRASLMLRRAFPQFPQVHLSRGPRRSRPPSRTLTLPRRFPQFAQATLARPRLRCRTDFAPFPQASPPLQSRSGMSSTQAAGTRLMPAAATAYRSGSARVPGAVCAGARSSRNCAALLTPPRMPPPRSGLECTHQCHRGDRRQHAQRRSVRGRRGGASCRLAAHVAG